LFETKQTRPNYTEQIKSGVSPNLSGAGAGGDGCLFGSRPTHGRLGFGPAAPVVTAWSSRPCPPTATSARKHFKKVEL